MRALPRCFAAIYRLALLRSLGCLPWCCAAALPAAVLAQPFPPGAAAPAEPTAPMRLPAWPAGPTGVETDRTDWRRANREVTAPSAAHDHAAPATHTAHTAHTKHTAHPAGAEAPAQPAAGARHDASHAHAPGHRDHGPDVKSAPEGRP